MFEERASEGAFDERGEKSANDSARAKKVEA